VRSLIATILHPSRCMSCDAIEPTLPNPCTATVVPRTFMPRCASASFVTIMQPRLLPRDARAIHPSPRLAGDNSGHRVAHVHRVRVHHPRHHALVRVHVRRGTSESGPSVEMIPAV
jgi:hypothetical protein